MQSQISVIISQHRYQNRMQIFANRAYTTKNAYTAL